MFEFNFSYSTRQSKQSDSSSILTLIFLLVMNVVKLIFGMIKYAQRPYFRMIEFFLLKEYHNVVIQSYIF